MLKTPDDFPLPPSPQNEEPTSFEKFCMWMGSFIVDGVFQFAMSFWWVWVILNTTGQQINQWLWALGMALLCSAIHSHSPELAGRTFIKSIQFLGILSILIWVSK